MTQKEGKVRLIINGMDLRKYKNREVYRRVGSVRIRGAKRENFLHVKPLAEALQKVVEERGYEGAELVVLPKGKGIRSGLDALGRPYLAISEDLLKTVKPSDVELLSFEGKSKMSLLLRPEIDRAIDRRLADAKTLERAFRRYERYRSYVEGELRKAGLPEELALLPVVESAYWRGAVSPKGAAGLWQLMPDTARQYGLKVDEEAVERYLSLEDKELKRKELKKLMQSDERFDVRKSTRAAVKFLKHLYERFDGDLDKVLAAYNAGPSRVEDLENFWSGKKKLPKETQNYVPDFYAVVLLYKDRQKYALLDKKQVSQEAPSLTPSL